MSQTIEVTPEITPEARQFIEETQQSTGRYGLVRIKTPEVYVQAGDYLQEIKGKLNRLEEVRKSLTRPLDESKKRIMDLFRDPEERLKNAEAGIKKAMVDYRTEQERIRQEEERKAQEEARKREAEEKRKLEEKAAKAAAKGNEEKAEELRQQAQEVFVPIKAVESTIPKVNGLSFKTVWKAKITDYSKLPPDQLCVTEAQRKAHQSHFNDFAGSTKGSMKISGIEFYSEQVPASSSR